MTAVPSWAVSGGDGGAPQLIPMSLFTNAVVGPALLSKFAFYNTAQSSSENFVVVGPPGSMPYCINMSLGA